MGAVILTGDLKDFRTMVSGDFGPLGQLISGAVTQFLHLRNSKRTNSVIISGQMVNRNVEIREVVDVEANLSSTSSILMFHPCCC